MALHRVPLEQWRDFVESFTRRYRGAHLSVHLAELVGAASETESSLDGADLSNMSTLSPEGWSLERLTLTQQNHTPGVNLVVQDPGEIGKMKTFALDSLIGLSLMQPAENSPAELRFDGSDGRVLLLRFSAPLVAGELDGIT